MRKISIRNSFVCNEDLGAMPEAEGGRACARCSHVVRALIAMRQADALALLREAEASGARVCVWQLRGPDGETLFLDSPPARVQLAWQQRGLALLLRAASMITLFGPLEPPEVAQAEVSPIVLEAGAARLEASLFMRRSFGPHNVGGLGLTCTKSYEFDVVGYPQIYPLIDCETGLLLSEEEAAAFFAAGRGRER